MDKWVGGWVRFGWVSACGCVGFWMGGWNEGGRDGWMDWIDYPMRERRGFDQGP